MPPRAHALYRDLFGGIEDLTQGKRLLIVPSGALTQLPFEALVTAKPDETLPRFEAYKKAAWLGQRQAITILPSVGSLKALRAAKASEAPEPFAGFGNPLLTGADGTDKSAWAKQDCGKPAAAEAEPHRQSSPRASPRCSGAARSMSRICAASRRCPRRRTSFAPLAASWACPRPGSTKAIHLGERATVTQVKALSQSGDAGPRPRGAFRHPWAARGRNRAVRQGQGRARAAADAARRRPARTTTACSPRRRSRS